MASVGLHLNLHNQNIRECSGVSWFNLGQKYLDTSRSLQHRAADALHLHLPRNYTPEMLRGKGVQKIVKMQNLGQKLDTAPFWNNLPQFFFTSISTNIMLQQCSGAGGFRVATLHFKDVSGWHFVECCAKHMIAKNCTDFQAFAVNLFWHLSDGDPGSPMQLRSLPRT